MLQVCGTKSGAGKRSSAPSTKGGKDVQSDDDSDLDNGRGELEITSSSADETPTPGDGTDEEPPRTLFTAGEKVQCHVEDEDGNIDCVRGRDDERFQYNDLAEALK